jgi:hypothetical protein
LVKVVAALEGRAVILECPAGVVAGQEEPLVVGVVGAVLMVAAEQ